MGAWRLKDAQEACETVFDRAYCGEPQIVMRDDKPMVVVVSFAAYEAVKSRDHTLLTTLRNCPCGDDLARALEGHDLNVPSYFERTDGFCEEGLK